MWAFCPLSVFADYHYICMAFLLPGLEPFGGGRCSGPAAASYSFVCYRR